MLSEHGLARFEQFDYDYHVSEPLGYLMMAALADVCAGTQKKKITDLLAAYRWETKYAAALAGAEYVTGLDVSQVAPAYDRLATLSLRVIDTDRIPLDNLVAMRKRESKGKSSDHKRFRRRYMERIEKYVKAIATEARTKRDAKAIEAEFVESMRDDLTVLKGELGLTTKKLVLSKEVVVSAVAIAGALIEPISGLTTLAATLNGVGVAALAKAGVEYRASRKKLLRESAATWLYILKSGKDPSFAA